VSYPWFLLRGKPACERPSGDISRAMATLVRRSCHLVPYAASGATGALRLAGLLEPAVEPYRRAGHQEHCQWASERRHSYVQAAVPTEARRVGLCRLYGLSILMMDLSEQGMAQRPRGGAFGTHYSLSHDAVWPHSQRLADEAPGHSGSDEETPNATPLFFATRRSNRIPAG
jgi:hypothetical protein